MTLTICKEVRKVGNGYIVEIRYPFGPDLPFGEVICKTWKEVTDLLFKAQDGVEP